MKFIKFTYVDSVTGISVASQPSANGPVFPNVEGLAFAFALESQYPTSVPVFFGTCPDSSATQVDGVIEVVTPEYFSSSQTTEISERAKIRRASEVEKIVVETASGLKFDGDEASQIRMMKAAFAMNALGTESTQWVMGDNSVVTVTASDLSEALSLAVEQQTSIMLATIPTEQPTPAPTDPDMGTPR